MLVWFWKPFSGSRSSHLVSVMASLAEQLENQAAIRNRARGHESGSITRWPKKELVGIASVKAMVINVTPLEVVASWWVSKAEGPSPIPIDDIRNEAFVFAQFFKIKELKAIHF